MTEDTLLRLSKLLTEDLDFHDQPSNYAAHNFHSFPAKFPPQLPQKFIAELTRPGDIVLDPMSGSGTTILEAFLAGRRGMGFDIDPLALRISRAKISSFDMETMLGWMNVIIGKASSEVLSNPGLIKVTLEKSFDPETKIFIDDWFLPETQVELFALLSEIKKIPDITTRNFFEVAFSSIIITKAGGVSLALDLGHTRPHHPKVVIDRSGRQVTGQLFEKAPSYHTKIVRPVFPEYKKRVMQNISGISQGRKGLIPPQIIFGNAQFLPCKNASVDLIVTSPPYASNAIDYMRAHKFSLVWFGYPLGLLGKKRRNYIGDEALIDTKGFLLPEKTRAVVAKLADLDQKKSLALTRYYYEMQMVLREMLRVLKPSCAAIVVVGNSIMRSIDTQTAESLAEIGREIGFIVPGIGVRHLDRDKRMLPASSKIDLDSQIQQRMHEEYVIGFYKTA